MPKALPSEAFLMQANRAQLAGSDDSPKATSTRRVMAIAAANISHLLIRYPHSSAANRWNEAPSDAASFFYIATRIFRRSHDDGQRRRTLLSLKYRPGNDSCLHQDLYGVFPLQIAILLSAAHRDLNRRRVQQRPHMQSRYRDAARAWRGGGLRRPSRLVRGVRGSDRVNLRHGVNMLRGGERYMLGIISDDA
jgi:uncharacterized protein